MARLPRAPHASGVGAALAIVATFRAAALAYAHIYVTVSGTGRHCLLGISLRVRLTLSRELAQASRNLPLTTSREVAAENNAAHPRTGQCLAPISP